MWAIRKRLFYITIILVILIILFGLPIYRSLNKTPTCSDGKQNGSELGVDCGGTCQKVCLLTAEVPIVLWSRSVRVRDGLYNSLAMIENPNIGIGATDVSYTFKLFDDKNILVYERKGKTNIAPQTRFPIFEGGIFVGERKPRRTFFEFGEIIDWIQQPKEVSSISITSQRLIEREPPRVEALISNKGSATVENLKVFVIVYDKEGNTIAGSETLVETLEPQANKNIVFTWPEPFDIKANRIEVIPKIEIK